MNQKDMEKKKTDTPGENDTLIGKKIKKDNTSFDYSSGNENSKDNENNGDYKTGRWEKNEHYKFLKGCLLYGNNWKKVKIFFFVKLI